MSSEKTKHSVNLDELTIDQLVQISQGLGHQVDKLREQRAYLNVKIAQRIAAGERNAPVKGAGDAEALGALIEASVK